MPKEVMERRASDNKYLHKDFHGALSSGIQYLEEHFGEESVREYLRQFTRSYYSPLIADLKRRGLVALKEHFDQVYAIEGSAADIRLSDDQLTIAVQSCPSVSHMRSQGYAIARLWVETTRTVNEALCEGTEYMAELLDYDPETGRGVQRFFRRAK